jgi:TRAP-type C4-dicarboxylate transport system substrate-binding protein
MDEKEEREVEFWKLLKEIKAEEEQELKSMTEGGELGFKMDEDLEAEYTQLLKQSGLNVEQLELQERKDAEATEKWIAEVTPALVTGGDEQQIVLQQLAEEREKELDQSLAGEDVEILTPVAVTVSDSDTLTLDLVRAVNEKEE